MSGGSALATVILSALSSIDQDISTGEVDGARYWRILFQIKLPLILPIMSIALLFSLISTFGDMVVYVLTAVAVIQVLAVWAYFKGLRRFPGRGPRCSVPLPDPLAAAI
jgi:multiple sugar transport system permease protein